MIINNYFIDINLVIVTLFLITMFKESYIIVNLTFISIMLKTFIVFFKNGITFYSTYNLILLMFLDNKLLLIIITFITLYNMILSLEKYNLILTLAILLIYYKTSNQFINYWVSVNNSNTIYTQSITDYSIELLNGLFFIHPVFFILLLNIIIYLSIKIKIANLFSVSYNTLLLSKIISTQFNKFIIQNYKTILFKIILVSIISGSWWAQQELNWNGYWSWDNIELISTNQFLLMILLIHSIVYIQKKKLILLKLIYFTVITILALRLNILLTRHTFLIESSNLQFTIYGFLFISIFLFKFKFNQTYKGKNYNNTYPYTLIYKINRVYWVLYYIILVLIYYYIISIFIGYLSYYDYNKIITLINSNFFSKLYIVGLIILMCSYFSFQNLVVTCKEEKSLYRVVSILLNFKTMVKYSTYFPNSNNKDMFYFRNLLYNLKSYHSVFLYLFLFYFIFFMYKINTPLINKTCSLYTLYSLNISTLDFKLSTLFFNQNLNYLTNTFNYIFLNYPNSLLKNNLLLQNSTNLINQLYFTVSYYIGLNYIQVNNFIGLEVHNKYIYIIYFIYIILTIISTLF